MNEIAWMMHWVGRCMWEDHDHLQVPLRGMLLSLGYIRQRESGMFLYQLAL